jgi:hypothetical protein
VELFVQKMINRALVDMAHGLQNLFAGLGLVSGAT